MEYKNLVKAPNFLNTNDVPVSFEGHAHGNIESGGNIGTTSGLIVKTTTGGYLTTLPAGSSGQFLRYDGTWATPPNTTYSAITTAEIDAGTSTTSRAITAQGLKYATDKVGITIGTTQPTMGWWFKEI